MDDLPFGVETLLWLKAIAGVALGLVLGSFVTMLSYRLPRGESIVWPRSRCALCKSALGVRDLVPLFSWIFHGGRCRHCGGAISIRYPAIEAVAATGSAVLFCAVGWNILLIPLLIGWVAALTLVVIALERLRGSSR